MKLVRRCVGYRFDLEVCKQEFQGLDKDGTGRLHAEDLTILFEVGYLCISLLLIRIVSLIFWGGVTENGVKLTEKFRT